MWFAQGLAAPAEVVPCTVAAPGDGRSCVRSESVPEEGLVSPKPLQLGMYCQGAALDQPASNAALCPEIWGVVVVEMLSE